MNTHFFPPFHDFAEALMASLASRSHEWTYWEIIEKNQIDSSRLLADAANANLPAPKLNSAASLVVQTEIEIFLKNKGGNQILKNASLKSVHSPSYFLDQVFDTLLSTQTASANSREAFQSAKRTLSTFSENPLKEDEISARIKALGSVSAIWIRGKNSEGQYLEALQAPKN